MECLSYRAVVCELPVLARYGISSDGVDKDDTFRRLRVKASQRTCLGLNLDGEGRLFARSDDMVNNVA